MWQNILYNQVKKVKNSKKGVSYGSCQNLQQGPDYCAGCINFNPKSVIETGNINTGYRLAANGYGVTFIPETYVHNSSSSVQAKVFSFGHPCTKITLAVVYKKDSYMSKSCQIFLDMIKEFYMGADKTRPENV